MGCVCQSWIKKLLTYLLTYLHHSGCVAPNVDISLQSGRFWAMLIASSRERLLDFRSCWIVFIYVVRWRPGGLLQFSKEEAVKVFLASVSSGIHAMWPNRERRRAWTIAVRCGCPVVRLSSSFHTRWYHLIPNSFHRHHWLRASILSTSFLITASISTCRNTQSKTPLNSFMIETIQHET